MGHMRHTHRKETHWLEGGLSTDKSWPMKNHSNTSCCQWVSSIRARPSCQMPNALERRSSFSERWSPVWFVVEGTLKETNHFSGPVPTFTNTQESPRPAVHLIWPAPAVRWPRLIRPRRQNCCSCNSRRAGCGLSRNHWNRCTDTREREGEREGGRERAHLNLTPRGGTLDLSSLRERCCRTKLAMNFNEEHWTLFRT